MKRLTSTFAVSAILAGSLLCGTAMADDTLPNRNSVLTAVSTTLAVQAQEMLHSAKAEIMASLQRDLSTSIAAVSSELVQETTDAIAETPVNTVVVAEVNSGK
ncbi:hypothetical protein KDN34_14625 [Shewanella yunxiaonensis]|uniref:Uncharacterized protein n=1 Tax=Shewanella yunxiaonensis TaxID=2829809 RepID=A0ABX7YRM1_9GAMM|nr:hypothetical protein [Shewanella yunxiaonensis]QUN05413.1 hypothetical protein KDN34_14625 [Shewanella yunxiaonensis]